jgi:hypothetical protein
VGGGHNAGSGYREACLQAVDCLADVGEGTVRLELAFVVVEVAGERPFQRPCRSRGSARSKLALSAITPMFIALDQRSRAEI